MTSANVTEFTIYDKATGKIAGHHRQHHYCSSSWDKLVEKFNPIENYQIQAWGYDEEDEQWEDEIIDLYDFLVEVGFIELT